MLCSIFGKNKIEILIFLFVGNYILSLIKTNNQLFALCLVFYVARVLGTIMLVLIMKTIILKS